VISERGINNEKRERKGQKRAAPDESWEEEGEPPARRTGRPFHWQKKSTGGSAKKKNLNREGVSVSIAEKEGEGGNLAKRSPDPEEEYRGKKGSLNEKIEGVLCLFEEEN